jgi:hypothetical protein
MYEAGCFFSAASLARVFRECGFQVLDVLPALGQAHLEIEARPSQSPKTHVSEASSEIAAIDKQAESFAPEHARQVAKWSERFEAYRREGKRVALWAAGMRAISLLVNVPTAAACVDYVVDVNPQRQGRFLPKTGQRVIAPGQLVSIDPDVVIATNPNYAEEIRAQLRSLGLSGEFEVLR